LPLAISITSVHVLSTLNRTNELLALRAGGVDIRIAIRPLLLVGMISLSIGYLHTEYIAPHTSLSVERFKTKYLSRNALTRKEPATIRNLPLEEGGYLIYKTYGSDTLFDVYAIVRPDRFWHMKELHLQRPIPCARKVDLFERKGGLTFRQASYDLYFSQAFAIPDEHREYLQRPLATRSIRELLSLRNMHSSFWKRKRSAILSHLYYKMVMPTLSLLVILAVAPFATRFSRNFSPYLIMAWTVAGYLGFFVIMKTCLIVGESNMAQPEYALFAAPGIGFILSAYGYLKKGNT
ncbi:MAG: LptF/LptG family permease, partial [Simkaniaceae bacterium]|nr:LptF/LptG family permease [Simkaniaceae bacterium]